MESSPLLERQAAAALSASSVIERPRRTIPNPAALRASRFDRAGSAQLDALIFSAFTISSLVVRDVFAYAWKQRRSGARTLRTIFRRELHGEARNEKGSVGKLTKRGGPEILWTVAPNAVV